MEPPLLPPDRAAPLDRTLPLDRAAPPARPAASLSRDSAGTAAATTARPRLRGAARKQAIGRAGEDLAAQQLTERGWTILARNWRGCRGELDIIATDGAELVVVEVKTRTSDAYGHPALAVDAAKLARLGRLGGQWLAEHKISVPSVRIDVIAIVLHRDGPPHIEHLRGVQP